ncbi:MAG: ABC transporter ATP-binding protein [Chloroflexota bacterium]
MAETKPNNSPAPVGRSVAPGWQLLPERSLRPVLAHRGPALTGLGLAGLGLAGVLAQALSKGLGPTGNLPIFLLVSMNALALAGLYFLAGSGLSLIFGLMRVVNMAHGSLYLLGGYIAWTLTSKSGVDWFVAILASTFTIGIVGLVIEEAFLRWNLGQDLRQALITIAISLVLADQMLANFGAMAQTISPPDALAGSVALPVYDLRYPVFKLVTIGVALAIGVVLWIWIQRTRFGILVRAGIDDGAMAAALGVNVRIVFAVAFFLGSCLAGLAGVFGGTILSLAPGLDGAFLLSSIVIVIVGGMGSLLGATVGALLLAFVQSYAAVYLPSGWSPYAMVLTFILVAAVLALKPSGLFGRAAA